jgi:hypothetical protein
MSTSQTKIRPRIRIAEPQRLYSPASDNHGQTDEAVSPEDSMPPLRVLARLPEVAVAADKSKLSLRLDWLQRLDWQLVRRIKLDPNWVAGGVLSLVLVLLLIITFNRNSKQSAEPTSTDEAPAWSTAGKSPQSTSSPMPGAGAAVSAATTATQTTSRNAADPLLSDSMQHQSPAGNIAPAVKDAEVRRLAAETSQPATDSLDGIYYPNTGYLEVTGHPAMSNAAVDQPFNGGEIRTAHRDSIQPYQATQQSAPPSGQARLDGDIITRPQP